MPALGLGITAVASVPGILDTFGRKITRARVGTTVHAFMPVAGNPPTAVPMIQWTLNGADLPGATGVYLTVPDLAGTLSWRGTDSDGTPILAETSAEVTGVTAEVTAPPVITLETAPTEDGLAPVTAGESLAAVLGRLMQTGLATTTGTGGVTTVATLLSGGNGVTDLTEGLTLDTLRFTYSASGAEDLVEDVAVAITVAAIPAPGPTVAATFGALTRVGAGGVTTTLTDGDHGQFTASSGVLSPRVSPLTPGTVIHGNTDVTITDRVFTVANVAEWAEAIDDAFAESQPTTVALRDGDYPLDGAVVPNIGRDWRGRELTTTFADTLHGARFVNGSLNMLAGHTLRGLTGYATAAWAGTVDSSQPASLLRSANGSMAFGWTVEDCLLEGEEIPNSEMLDLTGRPAGFPWPTGFDLRYVNGAYTIRDTRLHRIYASDITIMGGSTISGITLDLNYFDGLRLAGTNKTLAGTMRIEDINYSGNLGIFNELQGGIAPHPDFIQMQDASTPSETVRLELDRLFCTPGGYRGNKLQGIFGGSAAVEHLVITRSGVAVQGEHGISLSAPQDMTIVDSAAINYDGQGTSAKLRSRRGATVVVDSLFQGVTELSHDSMSEPDPATFELRNTQMNLGLADLSALTGPTDPVTALDLRAALVPVAAGALDGRGPMDSGGTLKVRRGVPGAPLAPALASPTAGTLAITRATALPVVMDGTTAASHDLRYREQGDGNPWTLRADIGTTVDVAGLSPVIHEVQTRIVTTDDVPGRWSPIEALEVTGAAAGPLYDFFDPANFTNGAMSTDGSSVTFTSTGTGTKIWGWNMSALFAGNLGKTYRITADMTLSDTTDGLGFETTASSIYSSRRNRTSVDVGTMTAGISRAEVFDITVAATDVNFVFRTDGATVGRTVTLSNVAIEEIVG